MQINSAEQAGFVTFLLVLLTNLGAAFAVSGGTYPSGVVVVVGVISAGVAGLLAYVHVAGIPVSTTGAASTTGTTPPP